MVAFATRLCAHKVPQTSPYESHFNVPKMVGGDFIVRDEVLIQLHDGRVRLRDLLIEEVRGCNLGREDTSESVDYAAADLGVEG